MTPCPRKIKGPLEGRLGKLLENQKSSNGAQRCHDKEECTSSRACSVTVSYKPPMLVTRVRLPACAYSGHNPEIGLNCGGQSVCEPNWLLPRSVERNAASEDRTHDLGIMRPTRYQLRYSRPNRVSTIENAMPHASSSFIVANNIHWRMQRASSMVHESNLLALAPWIDPLQTSLCGMRPGSLP